MEAAICTRCQSSNPIFTKFCLTCGLEITAAMRRTISVSNSGAPVSAPVAQQTKASKASEEPTPVGDNSNSPEPSNEPSPQKEGSRWFKGTRWFSRS